MARKKNRRRTVGESAIHGKAVKMRKMTDEQLVHYVEDRVEKARSEGYNEGRKKDVACRLEEVVAEIGGIKGIGKGRISEIREILEKCLLFPEKGSPVDELRAAAADGARTGIGDEEG